MYNIPAALEAYETAKTSLDNAIFNAIVNGVRENCFEPWDGCFESWDGPEDIKRELLSQFKRDLRDYLNCYVDDMVEFLKAKPIINNRLYSRYIDVKWGNFNHGISDFEIMHEDDVLPVFAFTI